MESSAINTDTKRRSQL